MAIDLPSPRTKYSQPFKKRKIEKSTVPKPYFDSKDSVDAIQDDDVGVKYTQEESEATPEKHVTLKKSPFKDSLMEKNSLPGTVSPRVKIQSETDGHCTTGDLDNTRLGNDSAEYPYISIRKIEDLCATPKKTCLPSDGISQENDKVKSIVKGSPSSNSKAALDINFVSPYSTRIKTQPGTPVSSKKGKRQLSNDGMQEYTPKKEKKRKVSIASDYDQLSDTVKLELSEAVNLDGEEPIDLLHDLDTMIDFEDMKILEESKVSSDLLLHLINNGTTISYDQSDSELPKDPPMDPLFIAANDKANETVPKRMTRSRSNIDKCKYVNGCNEKASKKSGTKSPSKKRQSKSKDDADSDGMYEVLADIMHDSDDASEHSESSSENMRNDLYNLEIQLIHEVPPQHKVEHLAGTKPPTQTEKRLFQNYGPLRTGVFSPIEDEILMQNWKAFCKKHFWDPEDVKPFICMKGSHKYNIRKFEERQKFVRFLANGLPWRTLYSVYSRFQKLHEKSKPQTRYTPSEDKQILAFLKKRSKKKNYAELAKQLGRTKHSLWMRCERLKKMKDGSSKPSAKTEWTIPLITSFLKHLQKVTISEDIRELKDATIPKAVWKKVGEKMKMDYEELKAFWFQQLHMQLFCPSPIYLNDIKIMLIEYMYGKGISNTREIIWPNVAKYFEGVTTIFLCKLFCELVRDTTAKRHLKYLPDILEYLYNNKIPDIRDAPTDKYLPRLSYINGKVKVVDDDTSS